jgi:uncharacterized RDD family membrane protein YckC
MAGLWGKRFAALFVDFIMITLFLWVIIALLYPVIAMANLFALLNVWVPIAAVIIIVYFTYFEGKYSTTPGKNLMRLKIKALNGEMNYKKAFIRSLSKILWLPLILDVIIGLFMSSPKKRLLDRLAKTEVVVLDEVEPPLKVKE